MHEVTIKQIHVRLTALSPMLHSRFILSIKKMVSYLANDYARYFLFVRSFLHLFIADSRRSRRKSSKKKEDLCSEKEREENEAEQPMKMKREGIANERSSKDGPVPTRKGDKKIRQTRNFARRNRH